MKAWPETGAFRLVGRGTGKTLGRNRILDRIKGNSIRLDTIRSGSKPLTDKSFGSEFSLLKWHDQAFPRRQLALNSPKGPGSTPCNPDAWVRPAGKTVESDNGMSITKLDPSVPGEAFNAFEKERQLRHEAVSWDISGPQEAREGDIPVIDLSEYFTTGSASALRTAGAQLRQSAETIGFFSIIGHQVPTTLVEDTFDMVRQFHALPKAVKEKIMMDRSDWPVGGVGYLPVGNRKLPARPTANLNETFIIKRDDTIQFDDNQWLDPDILPGFRARVETYALALETMAKRLLPVFATALDMPAEFFRDGFEVPQYRLRMTHYPPVSATEADGFGISPHVDTSFCTILCQDRPGLTIFDERRQGWIKVPLLENAFIVNSGELLKQWTNDRFVSVKHFANNNAGSTSRYSIPFFFNANTNHRMECVPSCHGPDNPAKYPAISYAESQAVAQGE